MDGEKGSNATLRAPTGRKRWGAGRQMQVAVSGEAGMEKAKAKAKALQGMFRGTVFKGKVLWKGTGTNVNKRARSETQRSAARWGPLGHERGPPRAGTGQPQSLFPSQEHSVHGISIFSNIALFCLEFFLFAHWRWGRREGRGDPRHSSPPQHLSFPSRPRTGEGVVYEPSLRFQGKGAGLVVIRISSKPFDVPI